MIELILMKCTGWFGPTSLPRSTSGGYAGRTFEEAQEYELQRKEKKRKKRKKHK